MKTTTYLSTENGMTITICDKPEPTKSDLTRAALTIAITAYDYGIRLRAARNPRVYHNPFALGLYSEAVDRVVASLAQVVGDFPKGRFILRMKRHAFCLIDGKVHDYDYSSGRSRIYDMFLLERA